MFEIPRFHQLTGSLVCLRTPQEKDYPALQEVLNDEVSMEALFAFFKVKNWTLPMVKERYENFQRQQDLGLGLSYVVIHIFDQKIVGNCGLKNIDLKRGQAEFGIILHQSVWGKGISQECHLLCLNFAFNELKLEKVYFTTDEHNVRMKGFFQKMGIPRVPNPHEDSPYFELAKKDWPRLRENLQAYSKPSLG